MSALRGGADFDGDGRVTLDELYAYAYRHTTLRTGTSAAAQHPALSAHLAGAGELELTRPTSAAAALELPTGGDRYVIFAWPTAAALAQVERSDPRRIALPAGRYLVTERRSDRFFVARADLVWQGYTRLEEREFRPIAREELVARGGRLELHPFRLRVLALGEAAPTAAAGWRTGLDVSAQWAHGALLVQADTGAVVGPARTDALVGQEWSLRGGALVGARWLPRRVELALGVGLELRWIWQSLDRTNAATLAGTPLQTHLRTKAAASGPASRRRRSRSAGARRSSSTPDSPRCSCRFSREPRRPRPAGCRAFRSASACSSFAIAAPASLYRAEVTMTKLSWKPMLALMVEIARVYVSFSVRKDPCDKSPGPVSYPA